MTNAEAALTLLSLDDALDKAITAAGGAAALARHLGITSQAISQWDRVPVTRAAAVERLTGIPRAELRPDVFGKVAAWCACRWPRRRAGGSR